MIGDDRDGPVAESVDARAMHHSLSWFKSRPGLQPSLLPRRISKGEGGLRSFGLASQPTARWVQLTKMPVDGAFKTLSRLRNLV
jgi:hypothetical protein